MPTPLSVTHQFSAPVDTLYEKLTSQEFLDGRLTDTGGLDPQVVRCEHTDTGAVVVTRQSIPSSVLPGMVAAMIQGDPVTERTETWSRAENGYVADLSVVIKGAPASLKGTFTLKPTGDSSCELVTDGNAIVPIPLFGPKVEQIVVTQVRELLDREAAYTEQHLAG